VTPGRVAHSSPGRIRLCLLLIRTGDLRQIPRSAGESLAPPLRFLQRGEAMPQKVKNRIFETNTRKRTLRKERRAIWLT
jgi:hypothetical protein